MKTSLNHHENQTPSLVSGHHNGLHHSTPATFTRSDPNNPYPTTFVQANTSSFKQIVQMLTGSSQTAATGTTRPDPIKNAIPLIKPVGAKKERVSKLYERRNNLNNHKISTLVPGLKNYAPGPSEILSPSMFKFPSLVLSPVTTLVPDPFNRSPHNNNGRASAIDMEAENKAIADKGFYLHPSPSSGSEPRLLPLFPVTSPRLSGSS